MAFFKQFPKIEYDFNREGVINNMVDIYRSVRPLQNFVDDSFDTLSNGLQNAMVTEYLSNFFVYLVT